MATLRTNLTIPADLKEELSKYPDIKRRLEGLAF
jgi:hypothetical protein